MKKTTVTILLIGFFNLGFCVKIMAQNPIVRDQYTADPTARVFGDKVYVYPSHDNANVEGKGRKGWFCMEDYHVFSSSNLTEWKDHGMIVSQYNVNWVDSTRFSMWAPDCIERNGKYYFYFPAGPNDTIYGRGFAIGVAISDNPYGPFIPQPGPIKGVHGIDPNVFIDNDGQAYLYWSMGKIFVARLNENMLDLDSEPVQIEQLPTKGLIEGPYLFERNGNYYMTYPHVENNTERLEYAMGKSPVGPFTVTGVIMDESPTGCWTNHHSVINYKKQWYLFYHHNDLSPHFDKNRSIRIDSLFFNQDGTIKKVMPTLRGVGLTSALSTIEIDRYTSLSNGGASVEFIDTLDKFGGWKTILEGKEAWIKYNAVDFGKKKVKSVQLRTLSKMGATIQIFLDNTAGEMLAEIKVPESTEWITVESKLTGCKPGIQNLIICLKDDGKVELDWIKFK